MFYSLSFYFSQLVNAKTCEVGCAIAHCPDVHSYSYYHHYLAHNGGHPGANNLLVICYYGPGYSEDYHTYLHKLRPYLIGPPCSRCPEQYSECDAPSRGAVGSQSTTAGLCCECNLIAIENCVSCHYCTCEQHPIHTRQCMAPLSFHC